MNDGHGHLPAPKGPAPTAARIFALHGFSGLASDLDPLARALGEGMCVAMLPGHGCACPPDAASAFDALVAAWNDSGCEVLLGYSMGARIARALALAAAYGRAPGEGAKVRVPRALILLSPTSGALEPAEIAARDRQDDARAEALISLGTPEFLARWDAHPLLVSQTRARANQEALARASIRARYSASALAVALRAFAEGRLRARIAGGGGDPGGVWGADLGLPALPTLIIAGRDDAKYRLHADRLRQRSPLARLVSVPGGHAPHVEATGVTARAIVAFLTMPAPEPYRHETTIKFHDIDAAGMMFFAQAFVHAHDAYEGFIRDLGVDHATWFGTGDFMMPIRHAACDFRQPLRLGQRITIVVEPVAIGASSVRLRYRIESERGVHAVVELVHVCIDPRVGVKRDLPDEVRARLAARLAVASPPPAPSGT